MPDTAPSVSVVIPTYNCESYLRQAVQSVFDQTYTDWEAIVIDDGSTDGTASYLDSVADDRVRVLRHVHCGNPARLRNVGIAAARGAHVAFLDSDDVWFPQKLEAQLEHLLAHPSCGWSYTYVSRIDEQGDPLATPPDRQGTPYAGWILERLMTLDAIVTTPAVIVERRLLDAVEGFDESFVFCQEQDLWVRLSRESEVTVVPAVLAAVRSHRGSHTAGRSEVYEYWVRLYEKIRASSSEDRIKTLSKHQCAKMLVAQAAGYRGAGQYGAARRALFRSLHYRWVHGAAWIALVKTSLRPFMPPIALKMYRGLHGKVRGRGTHV
jgi:glycosyltransferase involved in cell wall biosynthesis